MNRRNRSTLRPVEKAGVHRAGPIRPNRSKVRERTPSLQSPGGIRARMTRPRHPHRRVQARRRATIGRHLRGSRPTKTRPRPYHRHSTDRHSTDRRIDRSIALLPPVRPEIGRRFLAIVNRDPPVGHLRPDQKPDSVPTRHFPVMSHHSDPPAVPHRPHRCETGSNRWLNDLPGRPK